MKIFDLSRINAIRLLILANAVTAAQSSEQQPLFNHDRVDEVSSWTSTWNFNFSSSAPHYFASIYGLLQQWPNTFFPNGHSVVPCEVPAFTKFYHGRTDGDVPPSPEWLAFDIGMAYGIMGGDRNSHMLTYQTTRAVKCVYFDGESATLFGTGQLDAQMLHIFGNVSGPPAPVGNPGGLWQEYARAHGLCDWLFEKKLGGSGWGYEGIVRMNAGFEMIWCNFASPSIRLVSHLNVTAPLLGSAGDGDEENEEDEEEEGPNPTSYYPLPPSPTRSDRATDPSNPPAPPNWRRDWDREPFFRTQTWNWFMSGVAHYGSSGSGPGLGETRAKIIGCGFLNYYTPKFTSASTSRAEHERRNLNLTKDGLWMGPGDNGTRFGGLIALTRRRRAHTLGDVSPSDAAIMRADSERVLLDLLRKPTNCSGMDWTTVTNEIVQTYASSLATFLQLLQNYDELPAANETAMKDWATVVRDQTHSFLVPFLEYPNHATDKDWKRDSVLFKNTFSRCRFHHTRLLDREEGVFLGPEESALKWAVEETSSGICSVLVDVGLSMEAIWASNFNIPINTRDENLQLESLRGEVKRWTEGIEELMAWLGWAGEWVSCEEKCAWDEECYIPMWPLIRMGGGPGRRPPNDGGPGNKGRADPHFPPSNGTGRRPGGGFQRGQDESDLWKPKCVKYDYLLR